MSVFHGGFPRVISAILLFTLAACAGSPEREGVTANQAHMYAHFDRTREVHDALVRGDLVGAQRGARWLATHQDAGKLPEGSERYATLMRTQAEQVSEASELQEAAMAAAQMASACGGCHGEFDVDPRFLMGAPPPGGSGAKAEMALHVWASERMWNGLVGPDDYAWTSGASALTKGWLSPRDVVTDPGTRERVRELVQQVYQIGTRAGTVLDPQARAKSYGEFLTTCIDCHRLTSANIG